MKFSEKIVYMRKKRNISQDRLAKKMGVSRQTIYKWEADLNTPEFNKIEKLAEILDISYDLLLDDNIDLKEYFNENTEGSETIGATTEQPKESTKNKKKFIIIGIAVAVIIAVTSIIIGIANDNKAPDDTDTDSNVITDTDTDTDTDTNTNTDTDTDTDTDNDVIVDTHNWDEWQEIDKGNCNTPQTLERICLDCDEKETKEGEILFEHKFSSLWYTKSPATCTETEIQFTKCSECNTEKYRDGVVAFGHAYDNDICVRCVKDHYTDGVIYKVYNGKAYVSGYEGTNSVVSISPYYTPKGETTKYPVTEVRRINSDVVTELIIPEGVEIVGDMNFNCFNLKAIRFPSTLLQIFEGTFTSCLYMERVYITSVENWCGVSTCYNEFNGGRFFNVPYDMYLNDELLTDLHITENVQDIMPYVFSNCKSIKTLTMEHNNFSRVIFQYAFENSGLEYAQIDCQSIYKHAFSFCSYLKSVKLSVSIYFPYISVFTMCYHLVEVYSEDKGIVIGDAYNYGGIGQYAKIIHTESDEPSVITETNDGFVFATIDNVNYLIQYVGSDPVAKLPRSFNGEGYTIASYFHEGGSPNATITEIYVPKEVKYIEKNALVANKQLKVYFEVVSSLTSWIQKLNASEYVFYGQTLDY